MAMVFRYFDVYLSNLTLVIFDVCIIRMIRCIPNCKWFEYIGQNSLCIQVCLVITWDFAPFSQCIPNNLF